MLKLSKLILISVLLVFCACNAEFHMLDYVTNSFNSLFAPSTNAVAQEESAPNGDARVVGGETSPVHYPYQISLQMKSKNGASNGFFFFQKSSNWSHFCGGSVLNENHIVTAAHCIVGFNTSRMSVFAGTKDLTKEDEGSRHLIDSCQIHPDYIELNNSDVAVCRIQTPFTFNDKISPIKLDTEYVGGGVECMLTGWGYRTMIRGFPLPRELQRSQMPTITNEDCNKRGHGVGPKEVCALSRIMKGACGGDSGGPLVHEDTLVGIVSYGTAICALGMPDVYTRASMFVGMLTN